MQALKRKRKRGRPRIGRRGTYTLQDKEIRLFSFFTHLDREKKSALIRKWIHNYNTRMLNKLKEMKLDDKQI